MPQKVCLHGTQFFIVFQEPYRIADARVIHACSNNFFLCAVKLVLQWHCFWNVFWIGKCFRSQNYLDDFPFIEQSFNYCSCVFFTLCEERCNKYDHFQTCRTFVWKKVGFLDSGTLFGEHYISACVFYSFESWYFLCYSFLLCVYVSPKCAFNSCERRTHMQEYTSARLRLRRSCFFVDLCFWSVETFLFRSTNPSKRDCFVFGFQRDFRRHFGSLCFSSRVNVPQLFGKFTKQSYTVANLA